MPAHGEKFMGRSHVVIIGAGLGGLACAIALERQLGFYDFTIFEQAEDVGGTWWDNSYPGCGCDTPIHWYSLSTDLNPYWSTTAAPQPEILAYWKSLVEKYTLYPRTVFHTKVISATWDNSAHVYTVEVEDLRTGERTQTHAQVVISAAGYLVEPRIPEVLYEKGLRRFKGPMFHSARWDHELKWSGKKVAVIGNGASAAQFIPRLIEDPTTHVVNFCRTPNWFLPSTRSEYTAWQKWIFAHIPLTLRLYRNWLVMLQTIVPVVRAYWRRWISARNPEEELANYIKRTAPKRYHEKLIPTHPLVCRRPILDPGYLECLYKPNVELIWDGIAEIGENGIKTVQGENFEADVIILSTGFVTDRTPVVVTGSTGKTLEEYFTERGGPTAYQGVSVPGFPNFFFVGGPNTVTSSGSTIFNHEISIGYIIQLLHPLLRTPISPSYRASAPRVSAISARPEPHDVYNAHLQSILSGTTWMRCASWYRAGADGLGKNFGIFPGSLLAFWWLMRKVKWEDYNLEYS